jgi:hypothetical protein
LAKNQILTKKIEFWTKKKRIFCQSLLQSHTSPKNYCRFYKKKVSANAKYRPPKKDHGGFVNKKCPFKVKPVLRQNNLRPFRVRSDQINGFIRTYEKFGTTAAVHGSIPTTTFSPLPNEPIEQVPALAVSDLNLGVAAPAEQFSQASDSQNPDPNFPETDPKVKITTPQPSAYPRIQFGWNELIDELNPDAVTHPTLKPTPPPVVITTTTLASVTLNETAQTGFEFETTDTANTDSTLIAKESSTTPPTKFVFYI